MTAVHLTRVDLAQNLKRFYRLDVQPDLFGGWSFIREWGRIGNPGTVRIASFDTVSEAEAARDRQWHAKEQRGYTDSDADAQLSLTRSP
ncbi:WGR domain-containing protein [Rhodoplanes serenus]|uniref:WGR domain-containing protein n=1 Tax=Rhodoplanes serenus TaxID=200615 RepID=UPI000DAC4A96|nr:WGR domain-containing protein [Rhodoplanes serenus]RAI35889.1 hypothetical protein CH340_04655 [Rhodoplanes serenus]